jgi:hypothetical protein
MECQDSSRYFSTRPRYKPFFIIPKYEDNVMESEDNVNTI